MRRRKCRSELQISREESEKAYGGGKCERWSDAWRSSHSGREILAGRAQSFAAGGVSREAALSIIRHEAVSSAKESSGLLRQRGKINRQFGGFLGETGMIGGEGSLKPEMYWELLDVDACRRAHAGRFL